MLLLWGWVNLLLEIVIIEPFDLLEFQKKARETCCPKRLFELWEDVSGRYDRHQIGEYEYEEMKEAIWPNLHALDSLRRSINETEQPLGKQQRKLA